jgi:hypothetical protein
MKRRRIAPFAVVLMGSPAITLSSFSWRHPLLVYGGSATIFAGALWSAASKPRNFVTA